MSYAQALAARASRPLDLVSPGGRTESPLAALDQRLHGGLAPHVTALADEVLDLEEPAPTAQGTSLAQVPPRAREVLLVRHEQRITRELERDRAPRATAPTLDVSLPDLALTPHPPRAQARTTAVHTPAERVSLPASEQRSPAEPVPATHRVAAPLRPEPDVAPGAEPHQPATHPRERPTVTKQSSPWAALERWISPNFDDGARERQVRPEPRAAREANVAHALPSAPVMEPVRVPAPTELHIGRIHIEVVLPEPRPKPQVPAKQASPGALAAPAKPAWTPRSLPFGARQR